MDWRYLAGFFDGEGNINALKVKRWYFFQIRIYSTDKWILEKIVKFLGYGIIYARRRVKHHNVVYELYLTKKEEIKRFLKNITPYLNLKEAQSKYVLENIDYKGLTDENFSKEKFQGFVTRAKLEITKL